MQNSAGVPGITVEGNVAMNEGFLDASACSAEVKRSLASSRHSNI